MIRSAEHGRNFFAYTGHLPMFKGSKKHHFTFIYICKDSFPVPTYLFIKGDERSGTNDVKVAGQAGKGSPIFVRPSLDAMRSSQNRLRSDRNESDICIYHSMQMFLPFHWPRAHHVTCK